MKDSSNTTPNPMLSEPFASGLANLGVHFPVARVKWSKVDAPFTEVLSKLASIDKDSLVFAASVHPDRNAITAMIMDTDADKLELPEEIDGIKIEISKARKVS